MTTRQRMCRFLQVQYTQRTLFKAFGDPRFVSRTTVEQVQIRNIDRLANTR